MPYQDEWDEAAPAGSAAANTLDTIIQNVKRSIRERMDDLAVGFGDDDTDPKRIKVHFDTDFPTDPEVGEVLFNETTGIFYIWDGDEWINLSGSALVNTLSNRPAADTVSEGTLFYASDSEDLYVKVGEEWVNTVPTEEYLVYSQTETFSVLTATEQAFICSVLNTVEAATPEECILVQVRARFKQGSGDFGPWVHQSFAGIEVGTEIEYAYQSIVSNYADTYHWLATFVVENTNVGTQSITGEVEITLRNIGAGVLAEN
jgi:hypothetical protein